jgi:phospholipase/carboxylesterase
MNDNNLLECVEHETGPAPTHSVIWLHGLGADGHDFAPIVPELRLPASKAVRFVFPHATVQPVTINGGMAMRSWYDILTPQLVKREDAAGIRLSEQAILALIARENSRGVPSANIVLAGFSQGCAIACECFAKCIAPSRALAGFFFTYLNEVRDFAVFGALIVVH